MLDNNQLHRSCIFKILEIQIWKVKICVAVDNDALNERSFNCSLCIIYFQGIPKECFPDQMTITQSMIDWLSYQISWQHDPCEEYLKAFHVNPLWKIPLLMVCNYIMEIFIFS